MADDIRAQMDVRSGERQDLLIRFLFNDLDLAFSVLNTARFHAKNHPEQVPSALATVRQSLWTIRELTGRVQDRAEWQMIHSRTDELEAEISRAFGSPGCG